MSNKKNIDQLFKERFANHKATPSAQVWEKIQAKMRVQKKDRKVIPLWWKVGGVAALLAIMFTIGNTVFNSSEQNKFVEETLENRKVDEKLSPYIITEKDFNTNSTANDVAEETNTSIEIDTESTINIEKTATEDSANTQKVTQTNTINTTRQEIVTSGAKQNATINTLSNKKNTIVQNSKVAATVTNNTVSEQSNTINSVNTVPYQDNGIAAINKSDKNDTTKSDDTTTVIAQTDQKDASIENIIITNKEIETIHPNNTEAIAAETGLNENKIAIPESEKQSIFDAIKEQEEVASTEEVTINNSPIDRWEVSPNFAPVYYNTLSEGSSIDGSFSDNAQSSDVNISYGVAVSYAVSDRLSIRSGVNNVNLGYSTGGLELGEGDTTVALSSINYNGNGQVTIPQDIGTFSSQGGEEGFGNITPKSTSGEAFINQNINYYEIPLELKYSLFDTKFGINLIGGLSTLFLGENEITVNAGDFSETLGEANNLSGVSFSTNVGLGFDYKFSDKFKFNIEPIFKYQLNPYTDNSVDFQPYYVGVYTGLSFKF